MSLDSELQEEIQRVSKEIQEVLGLDRWDIRLEVSRLDDARACCQADPEYKNAVLTFDPEKLRTGDDLQEVIVHEHVHCLLWPLHAVAEQQSKALQALMDEDNKNAQGPMLDERVRYAAECATTDFGWVITKLWRRVLKLESELKAVKARLKEVSNA